MTLLLLVGGSTSSCWTRLWRSQLPGLLSKARSCFIPVVSASCLFENQMLHYGKTRQEMDCCLLSNCLPMVSRKVYASEQASLGPHKPDVWESWYHSLSSEFIVAVIFGHLALCRELGFVQVYFSPTVELLKIQL